MENVNNQHIELIKKFYENFGNNQIEPMLACYHSEATFEDPAFGKLNTAQTLAMWRMLLERSGGNIKIQISETKADGNNGETVWVAEYVFAQTKRKVVNRIKARFEFKDGLIYRHVDNFDLWAWSRQALGLPAYVLGWTGFFKGKIRQNCSKLLAKYMSK